MCILTINKLESDSHRTSGQALWKDYRYLFLLKKTFLKKKQWPVFKVTYCYHFWESII